MRVLQHALGTIYVPGPNDSLDRLYRLSQSSQIWAADTETTGTNPYERGFRVRIVQVGTRDEAWILRPEWHFEAIAKLTMEAWWHNHIFDCLALETALGLDFDETADSAQDTELVFRLADPRGKDKGGTGHRLEDLGRHYLGLTSKQDAKNGLLAEARRLKLGIRAADVFSKMPVDNDAYLYYAGQDVLLTARLAEVGMQLVKARGLQKFVVFETPLWNRLAQMQRIGFLFDEEWAAEGEKRYDAELERAEQELIERWGIARTARYAHTSRRALQKRFEEFGVKWEKFSEKSGTPSLDADVLAGLSRSTDPRIAAFASAILTAKRNKHYGDYIRAMRAEVGVDGRIHPNIRPMQAATARMSITNPPLQQFPRNDPTIRGCLIADEGQIILSADFAQVELRIGAAVSGDKRLQRYITEGVDIHALIAKAVYGPNFTKEQRNICKGITFGRLYMGTPKGILRDLLKAHPESGMTLPMVKRGIRAFDTHAPAVVRWGTKLMENVKNGNPILVTATGRPLIVDKPWAAPNYAIQSVARDVFAVGINELHRRGLGEYLRLVVHDEVVLSVPEDQAVELAREVEDAMSTVFRGVPIETESEIKGRRWAK